MIEALLEKLGIKSIDDLLPAERATYTKWANVLAKRDVTIEDLKQFFPKELMRAHAELRKFENSKEKDLYYKAYAELCGNLSAFILGPTVEREQLKATLKQKYGIE